MLNGSLLSCTPDVEQKVLLEALDVLDTLQFSLPTCHNALSCILKRFIGLCINERGRMLTKSQLAMKQCGSKTACRSTVIL